MTTYPSIDEDNREPEDLPLPQQWRDKLIHMLGAGSHYKKSQHGFRNRYCANVGGMDYQILLDMKDAGLVIHGHAINDGQDRFFFATEAGCKAIGLSKAATKRAMSD